jgi:hypothetical protein
MRTALSFCVLLASCTASPEPPPPIEEGEGVVAEVHLHQYAFGSHAAAGFLRRAVPYRRELDEQLVHFLPEPTAREGDCRLDLATRCSPACDGAREYCEASQCRPYTPLQFLDAGALTVTGSSAVSPLVLTFDPRIPGYRSGRPATAPIFAAGDRLAIVGPEGPWSFRADVVAPPMPMPSTALDLPASGAMRVAWAKVSSAIAIRISVAGHDGAGGSIACVYDEDRGEAVIPESFIARLPPPPRSVNLSLERFERRSPAVAPGRIAVITVASTHVVEVEQ